MSSLALLIGADPQKSSGGPVVRLLPGVYNLHIEGLVNSVLALDNGEAAHNLLDCLTYTSHVAHDVKLTFLKRGNESHINVFAIRQ